MDNQEVKYTLILEGIEKLEKSLHSAKEHSDKLGESMHHLKEMALELVGAYVGFEVLKESVAEFREHTDAVSKLTAMYENNKNTVHENLDQLKELAEKQESLTGIHSENTMAAEANLMKYRDLKISYEDLIPIAADFAKVQGTDVADAANLMGRALSHPEQAMRLLRQAGVSLNKEQIKTITHLQAAGKGAEVQAKLFEVLKDKFHGVAQAMFESNPLNQLDIQFKQVKESIGQIITEGLSKLMPYIIDLAKAIKGVVHWIEENTKTIKALAIAIGVGLTVYYAYNAAIALSAWYTGLSTVAIIANTLATEGLSAAMVALDLALDANPVILIAAAIAGLTLVIYECITAYSEWEEISNKNMKDARQQEIDLVNDQIAVNMKYKMTLDEATDSAIKFAKIENEANISEVKAKISQTKDAEKLVALQLQLTEYTAKGSVLGDKKNFQAKSLNGSKGNAVKDELAIGDKSSAVTGTKQVIINVSINKLVETIKIMAQNIKDGANQATPHVADALLSAVNQFSASADL